jgi:L-alanine-DL-glutamate epimerase-like enolase superfamily enzyme
MKISEIALYPVSIELTQPFTTALGRAETVRTVVVRVADDRGNVGWGEAVPRERILGETTESVIAAIGLIAIRILGEDPRRIERIAALMDEVIYHNTAAKAGIDIAIHDLLGRIWSEPLWRLLGGYRMEQIDTDFTIGIQDLEGTVAEARDLVAKGFKTLKVKVGGEPDSDVRKIKLLREALGEAIHLRVDANQGWTRQQAIKALNQMAEYGIEFAEQPIAAHDITGLAQVRRSVPIPIMADESVHQPEDAIKAIQEGAADYINIKLMKSGGFWKARQIATIAEAGGVGCMMGGMVESDLAATAAVHFAAACRNIRFRDLDMGVLLKDKVLIEGGSELKAGYRTVPDGPGLGIARINERLLGEPIRIDASKGKEVMV